MFENSYWVPYLCVAIASGFIGLALLVYRAGLSHPPASFPVAGAGFVGAGAVCAVFAAAAYASDRDNGFMITFLLAGVLVPVTGWVASLFSADEATEPEES